MHNFIRTFEGFKVSLEEDSTDCFCVKDIARGLAQVNRFNGHTRFPYSVALHSVHVASRLPKELQKIGLFHDASEAYLIDMPSPHKRIMPDYRHWEDKTQNRIWRFLGLDPEHVKEVYPAVKEVDLQMLYIEGNYLQPFGDFPRFPADPEKYIIELQPRDAIRLFLWAAGEIEQGRKIPTMNREKIYEVIL